MSWGEVRRRIGEGMSWGEEGILYSVWNGREANEKSILCWGMKNIPRLSVFLENVVVMRGFEEESTHMDARHLLGRLCNWDWR